MEILKNQGGMAKMEKRRFESVGACELISEMLEMSKELTYRKGKLDNLDLWRIIQTIENLTITVSKELFSKLSKEEQKIAWKEN